MKTIFITSSNLITNFKPSILKNFRGYKNFKKNKHQKFCKNFLIYILLLKYKSNIFKKSEIFIKKYKKNVYTILRSPYRHKLARHQIFLQRYNINFSIKIELSRSICISNFYKIIKLVIFLKKFSNIFESNLIYIKSIKFSINLNYYNNFYYKNFLNKKVKINK